MSNIFIVFQIALLSFVTAQPQNGMTYEGWRFRVEPAQTTSTSCLPQSQPVAQRDDYTYTAGLGGYKVHTLALTWAQARRTCEEEAGHLAIINSIAESNVVADLFKKAGPSIGETGGANWAHIGFHDLFEEGEYLTIHSQTLAKAGFTRWELGQPGIGDNTEDCGCFHKNGGLGDITCSYKLAFICEIPHYTRNQSAAEIIPQ